MNTSYPAIAERSRANAIARRITCDDVRDRKEAAQTAIADMLRAIGKFREAGASVDFVDDALRGLLDEASNIKAGLATDLDSVGIWSDELLDLSEVNEALAKVRS